MKFYNMKKLINKTTIIAALVLLSQLSFAQTNWKQVKSKEGITVFQEENSQKKYKTSKVEFTVDFSPEDFIKCISNFDDYSKWNSSCTQSKLLKKIDSNNWIYYSVFSAPFIQDRELFAKATLKIADKKTSKIHIEACPTNNYKPNNKYVRINNFYCDYTITETARNKSVITVITSLDMAGSLSPSMVNKFSANSLYSTFYNLRKQCNKQLLASK